MDPVHARYPFLESAREAVREADVGLGAVVAGAGRSAAVERGVERVRRALLDGTVEPEETRRWGTRAEVLSYPVARVLVSLLDAPGAVEKYASAEADTAFERFTDDFAGDDELRSTADSAITLDALLAEFDLRHAVERSSPAATEPNRGGDPTPTYRIAVARYLQLASGLDGDRWRLVRRELADGEVRVTEAELHDLLREAVRERVAEGLPADPVPDEIAAGLTDEIAALEETFSEVEIARDIDVLAPEHFPPCVEGLVERARSGDALDAPAVFALLSFLASTGTDLDTILGLLDEEPGSDRAAAIEYRLRRVGEEGDAQYPPPSCATMHAYGECPQQDETDPTTDPRCETVQHPLAYYEDALADGGTAD